MIDELELLDVVEKKQCIGFSATFYSTNLIEIVWSPELKQVETSHLEEVVSVIKEFGQGKKIPIYYSTHDLLTISADARVYAASNHAQDFSLAIAVLSNSLATKLIFNFFIRVNRPKSPTRSFSNKEEAFVWLLKKKRECDLVTQLN